MENSSVCIQIRAAEENNLQAIDVDIPLHQFVVVTGISGSGKSSLSFDVIASEGQRRYLESMPGFARRFAGKLVHPKLGNIENLPAVIAISQKTVGGGPRSTLGSMSDLYDYLRLLFARIGKTDKSIKLSRALFSFNSSLGACPHCTGLGLEERISLEKLIVDPSKSLREGALAPTLPTGYIMYTQLTMDSMDMLCKAHGFSVDLPWNEMTDEQKHVVLYGSNKIKVPIGKHSLESRLKWEGIAAKPREEDYYKGIINIMSDILRRDRNKNILKYVESLPCSHCNGSRLNEQAMSVTVHEKDIFDLSQMPLSDLKLWMQSQTWSEGEKSVAEPIVDVFVSRIQRFENLGMGHLSLHIPTESLSMGDTRRIRLINQLTDGLSDVLYIFDEAFVGLHPEDHQHLLDMMQELVVNGNTVMLVEHDEQCIRQADYIVDIGPLAGKDGGQLLFSGALSEFLQRKDLLTKSETAKSLYQSMQIKPISNVIEDGWIEIEHAKSGILKGFDYRIKKSALNVLTGLSGSGKSELIYNELIPLVEACLAGENPQRIHGLEGIKYVHLVSRKPIGRTPRSNPATYTKLSDVLRDLFSNQASAKASGLKKSHFSFNTKGGRCETCLGAGKIQIGMHFLGNVDLECPECKGKRFKPEILKVKYKDKSIAEVYDMTVNQAIAFFEGEKKIVQSLQSLKAVGLGYIALGQSSTTLSGGEAQRVKLAAHLQKARSSKSLFILDEPANGLHHFDVKHLLEALTQLKTSGNTVLCIAHNPELLAAADTICELGPGRGNHGGEICASGTPFEILNQNATLTAKILSERYQSKMAERQFVADNENIHLKGVTTHNLKQIDLTIPKGKMTVIAGVSGSGKSSLAFDTIAVEAESRFNESMSVYARSFVQQANPAEFESIHGLSPVISLSSEKHKMSERSTVGTMTGLYDYYRLLFSRIAQLQNKFYTAQDYSFNHQNGACKTCNGLGVELVCNPEVLVSNPELSIKEGALCGTSQGKYFGNPDGQFVAILSYAAKTLSVDIDKPYHDLSDEEKSFILYGAGDREFELDWHFKNKSRSGIQHLKSNWPGFCFYIEDEFRRKHQNKTADKLRSLMHEVECSTCHGKRLQNHLLDVQFIGLDISELSQMSIAKCLELFKGIDGQSVGNDIMQLLSEIQPRLVDLMERMVKLGIGYLSLDRRANSLSGGEMQRVRLAGALASPLYGVTYVLDEPSSSLHEKDIPAIIDILHAVKQRGNTVIVVEHHAAFMKAADFLIELGPAAGSHGGEIISMGQWGDLKDKETPTGRYLSAKKLQPFTNPENPNVFGVKSARANNLKHIDVAFHTESLNVISGVSGSGKSSLLNEVIKKSLDAKQALNCDSIYGFEQFRNIVFVDQNDLHVSAYSSVFTAAGLMDALRDEFAKSNEAKLLGLKRSAFSYVHKDGKCLECNGHGVRHISMDFMNDVDVICENCNGYRYKDVVLQCRVNGKHIGEVLQMPLDELSAFLEGNAKLQSAIQLMQALGLSHLTAGQSLKSLSAGERQRVKLLSELVKSPKGHTLFIFDEPAAGLHYADILKLIEVFEQILDAGHTMLMVEHRAEILQVANRHFVLGPGSGEEGGEIVRA